MTISSSTGVHTLKQLAEVVTIQPATKRNRPATRAIWIIPGGALAALGYWGISAFLRPMTPDEAATKTLAAFEHRDAALMLSLVPAYERRLYPNLSVAQVRGLLDLTADPHNLTPKGDATLQPNSWDGSSSIVRRYQYENVHPLPVEFGAEMREHMEGVPCAPTTRLLYLSLYEAGLQRNKEYPDNAPRAALYISGLDAMEPRLRSMGFSGVADYEFGRIISWSELRQNLENNRTFRMAR